MLDQCLIVVCDGDELKAVKKGLGDRFSSQILPIPIGIEGVKKVFTDGDNAPKINSAQKILVIGLGGATAPDLQVGDVAIYESCSYQIGDEIVTKQCHRELNDWLQLNLGTQTQTKLVKGLTTDKIITDSGDKKQLWQETGCSVVDMESYGVMDFDYCDRVSVIRTVSDNSRDDLPDLNGAITPEGKLDMVKMSIVFMKEPIKAVNLIKNALVSLKKLEEISEQLSQISVGS